MPLAFIAGAIIVACIIIIPVSVNILGKDNPIEEASEQILEESSKIVIDSLDGELGNEEKK